MQKINVIGSRLHSCAFHPLHRQVKRLLCAVTTLSTERVTNWAFVSLSFYKRKYLCLFDLTLK